MKKISKILSAFLVALILPIAVFAYPISDISDSDKAIVPCNLSIHWVSNWYHAGLFSNPATFDIRTAGSYFAVYLQGNVYSGWLPATASRTWQHSSNLWGIDVRYSGILFAQMNPWSAIFFDSYTGEAFFIDGNNYVIDEDWSHSYQSTSEHINFTVNEVRTATIND